MTAERLAPYLTSPGDSNLPVPVRGDNESSDQFHKEIIFKFIAELQREISELKNTVNQLATDGQMVSPSNKSLKEYPLRDNDLDIEITRSATGLSPKDEHFDDVVIEEDDLTMDKVEKSAIAKALERNHNNRKMAAKELHISERTLYRKIKEYGL